LGGPLVDDRGAPAEIRAAGSSVFPFRSAFEVSEPHDELVTLWTASGTEAEQRSALEHVRACGACRDAGKKLGVAIDALEGGTVGRAAETAPAGGLEKVLARARAGRLGYFTAQVAALFDLSTEAAAALLARAERNEGWEEGPGPGVLVMPVNAGPKVPEALTALVKLTAGATFPLHPHSGPERVLVLEGGYRDSGGVEVWRGEVQAMPPGSEHGFVAFDGIGCVCASVNALMPA
jgi:anti-sigma factor ChrR (cupin superfamily)